MPDEPQNKGQNDTLDVSDIFKKPKPQEAKPSTEKTPAPQQSENKSDTTELLGKFVSAADGDIVGALGDDSKKKKFSTFVFELTLNLLIVFALVFIIQTFFVSPFKVFGPSMCSTLNHLDEKCQRGYGEYIIVNKLIYKDFFGWSLTDPQRGDIIVFHPPHSQEQFYIKRVIGVPGDTVKIIDSYIYIFNSEYPTGFKIDESYLNEDNNGDTRPSTNKVTSFKVPDGQYFVLGDNRNESTDSRSCFRDPYQGGCLGTQDYFLPRSNVEGKAWVVLWPLSGIRTLQDITYFQ